MKVLVTGADGMLGQDLCPYLDNIGCFVAMTNRETMDITDFEQTKRVIKSVHPDLIIHCAAYTDVDKIESDIEKATIINVDGTRNVAIVCKEIGATMIYISTDYVFDGNKQTPYLVTDEPNPINKYGLTKYQGEIEVQKNCEKFYIVRTSWLYGLNGKNFVEKMLSMKNENKVRIADNQVGCPTWTMELIQGMIKILNQPYGIYHICGSGCTSRYLFAKEIFELSDLKVNLLPCLTDELSQPAKRPKYSVLENNGICRNWKDSLKDYLELRKD